MRKIVIFKLCNNEKPAKCDLPDVYSFKIWKPGIIEIHPPNKDRKYVIYWIFHYLHIFRSRDYSAVLVYHKNKIISSLLVVPAYYKWPFMQRNDIQFTYVLTSADYRGKGIAACSLYYAIETFRKENRDYWYVTDTENKSSINLCSKLGFKLRGYGKRNIFKNIRLLSN